MAMMKNFGLGSLSDFLGDKVLYRNLAPCDERLPGVVEVALGLPEGSIPRKTEPAYARIVSFMISAARRLDAPGARIHSLVFIGDTRLNDGTAFRNLCLAGMWKGLGLIVSETGSAAAAGAPVIERQTAGDGLSLFVADHWSALNGLETFIAEVGLPLDEGTVVVVDLDKTALGARGRNSALIDAARVEAVRVTVADLLGQAFREGRFREAYETLNQSEFHPFTRDNQDYLAYISLILGSGLYPLEDLLQEVRRGRFITFEDFIDEVDGRASELPPELMTIHGEIYARVQTGDPTPFKSFRRNEYRETVRRMGFLPMETPAAELLAREIVITAEVYKAAQRISHKGALIFGLSDKPDEASIPTPVLAADGYLPIHRTTSHIVGDDGR